MDPLPPSTLPSPSPPAPAPAPSSTSPPASASASAPASPSKQTNTTSNLPVLQFASSNSEQSDSDDPDQDPRHTNAHLQLPYTADTPSPTQRSPPRRPRLFSAPQQHQQQHHHHAPPSNHPLLPHHHNCEHHCNHHCNHQCNHPTNHNQPDDDNHSEDSEDYEIARPPSLLWRSLSSANRESHFPKPLNTDHTLNSTDDEHRVTTPKPQPSAHSFQPLVPSSPESPWSPAEIQRRIRQISRDPDLSEIEKNKRRQMVLSQPFQQRKKKEASQFVKCMNESKMVPSWSNVFDPDTGERMLGCEHYPRNCKIRASCCGMWVVCRLCHDDPSMDHAINRFATTEVMCMKCWTVQEVSEKCSACGIRFARYFCPKCKFYDNTPGKDIYHCDKCGICRVGKGIGHDNFHCDRCNACVSMEYSKTHRCLKRSLDADCPICGQYLFTSTKPVVFMRCGHTMHSHCFDVYTTEHFTCPLCNKALTNMKAYYTQIDEALKREVMPVEHRNKVAEVLCHDCDKRSETQFHFLYLKCRAPNCGSYNTRLLRTFMREEGSAAGVNVAAELVVQDGAEESDDEGEDGDDEMESEDSELSEAESSQSEMG